MNTPCRANLLSNKVFGVVSGKQREVKDSVRFGRKLCGVAGEEDDGRKRFQFLFEGADERRGVTAG